MSTDTQTIYIRRYEHELLQIEAWGTDGLRVRATQNGRFHDVPQALLPQGPVAAEIFTDGGETVIRNGKIEARVTELGEVRFCNSVTGAELLSESAWRPGFATLYPAPRAFKSRGGERYRLEARFKAYDGERLYGLGQHRHGFLDQKGCVVELIQRNAEVSIPFLVSNRGYGFLWNNPAIGRVELGHNGTRWVAESTQQLDYYITAGDSFADILAHYADAVGHAPIMPEWATGFWQSKCRYTSQEELLAVAREYQRRGLPLSVIVVDYFHWTRQGEWKWDLTRWPDPAAMVQELAGMGVKVMVSIWPSVNPNSENAKEMESRGLLLRAERGYPLHLRFCDTHDEGRVFITYYDATNPEARRFLWEKVRQSYYAIGIDTFWLDACEPEFYPIDHDNLHMHAGPGMEVGNIYPLAHQQAFYDGLTAEGEEQFVMLSRCGWAGSQRYGAAIWSGDIPSTFEMLGIQVRAGLNMAMSGIPWWTTDIGGFYDGDVTDPAFHELVVRWFQYGVFCPLCRLHGARSPFNWAENAGSPNEVWSFGEEAYGIIRELLFLRERLRPYLAEQMRVAGETGLPPMRPLFVDFTCDPATFEVDDQFLLGPDILVAPVLEAGARERRVYLPAGTRWQDAWTGEMLNGGQWVTAEAPLSRIPVYVRKGSNVPFRQSAD